MKRKIISLFFTAALLISLSACASIFDKEYFSATDYLDSAPSPNLDGAIEVKNYNGLKMAIGNLIPAHEETGIIDFRNYNTTASISEDLAAAAKEISNDTALGDYCVDYIHYDIDRIVAYYEATVTVIYKRTAEEVEALQSVDTSSGLYDVISSAMSEMTERVVVSVRATSLGADDIEEYVDATYLASPLQYVNRPSVTVEPYSGTGLQQIFDISIDYGGDVSELALVLEEVSGAVSGIAGRLTTEDEPYMALQAATLLIENCKSDETAGSNVRAALIGGKADSEGMALAYQAICSEAGIECVVVSGRYSKEQHYWNIITVDGNSYHVDSSKATEFGFASTFLKSDAEMWGSYWWDNEQYPICEGDLYYSTRIESWNHPVETDAPIPSPEELT